MAYKVIAIDFGAPLTHMSFYSQAQLTKKSEQLFGLKSALPLQELTNTYTRWCWEENNTLSLARKILRRLENKNFYQRVIKESYNSLAKFQQAAKKTRAKNFKGFGSKELAKILKDYLNLWIEATIWGHVINLSDFHFNLLSNKIIKIIEKKVKVNKIKNSAVEAFAILTTPTKRSLLSAQDLELLKLFSEIQKKRNLKSQLKNPAVIKKLKAHTKKYDWLQYHYLGPTILDYHYFLEILKSFIKQGLDGQKKIAEIIKREKETAKKQRELKRKLKFNQAELYWIEMAKEFGYLKGLRKEITFMACRSYDSLLKEIAVRLGLSLKQFQFMTPSEVLAALSGRLKVDVDLLNQRIKYCVVYYPQRKPKVYVGAQAEKLAKLIQEEKISKATKEIKGFPAYPGKVKGKVTMIFEGKDIKKMKPGGILVSPATNPNIMPAIVKAAAIVTDEGGITCHAAIVSRELKIPCVIGTKIATKVLKDGDRVEVDATKGIVKKI